MRLPEQFRFRAPVVDICRRGDEVVQRESAATLEEAFDLLAGLSRDFFAGGRKDDALPGTRAALKA